MSRRVIATVVATLMLFALLPATAAFAQATATAEIAPASRVVFPGDRTYTVTVRNAEAALIGRRINAVQVWLPAAAANVGFKGTPTAPSGWTAQVSSFSGGTTQFVTYKTTGQGIAPGSTLAFSLPTTVGQPARSDLAGDFLVKVSSTGFNTANNATPTAPGALTTAVEVLEVLQGTVRPIAPTNADNSKGVTDRTGTAGQTITYAFDVKNHAKEPITVTGSLIASDPGNDKPGSPVAQAVAPNQGVSTFQVPVTLGQATTANRSVSFTAHAVAVRADAAPRGDSFTVQSPVRLELSGLTPTRVRSGFGSAREFSVTAAKTGAQAFDLTSGTLSFGSNNIPLANPQTFAGGLQSATLRYPAQEISGADNDYSATGRSVGQDDNLADYNLSSALGLITIDNLIPDIELDLPVLGNAGKDADGDDLVAATNGTAITVTGTAVGTNDLDTSALEVELRPDSGDPISVPVSGSFNEQGVYEFSGSVSPTNWDASATRFAAAARIADEAGNIGTDQSGSKLVDLDGPVLDQDSGVILTETTIRVQFDDATGLRGACDPRQWKIAGTPGRVVDVRTSAGLSCHKDEAGEPAGSADQRRRALSTDGVRILVLDPARPLDWDETPSVTYDQDMVDVYRALGVYVGKDGARNGALTKTISTVTDLLPPMPDVTNIRRPDHETGTLEEATFDAEDNSYFTNVGGENALRATVNGVRESYVIEVIDRNGNVVHSEPATRPSILTSLATEWEQEISIPLGTTDGEQILGVRLLSRVGNRGPARLLSIVLDTAAPVIESGVMTGPAEALAYFNEKMIRFPEDDPENPDTVENWFVRWNMQREDDAVEVRSNVDDVVPVPDQPKVWRLILPGEINDTNFRGVDWARIDQAAKRYEDRAGNYMLNTFQ